MFAEGKILGVVVSDGAGSAEYGGEGASVTCRTIIQFARDHFRTTSDMPSDEIVWTWIDEVRDRLSRAADIRQTTPRQFSATLVAGLISPTQALIFHIGDGAVALRIAEEWTVPSWPESGEYAATTFFITDDPVPRLRLTRIEGQVTALAAFTDGIERLALNFVGQLPHAPFFNGVIRPIATSQAVGKNRDLINKLAAYLDSPAINERTDDDKTLVLAAWR